jgi:hypothetical protein
MNEKRRGQLRSALTMINSAASIIDSVYDKEQDCLDNYPENLQNTDRFECMENAVENLSDALEKIDEAKECISIAIR